MHIQITIKFNDKANIFSGRFIHLYLYCDLHYAKIRIIITSTYLGYFFLRPDSLSLSSYHFRFNKNKLFPVLLEPMEMKFEYAMLYYPSPVSA